MLDICVEILVEVKAHTLPTMVETPTTGGFENTPGSLLVCL
ncbi:hypothetical protein HSB1_31770 [Halogranum salarium B-1]|uniref:Uncharacterized protein n=1 Tax=Halogranum salarium B-1 TaxID=1210908 RepID=J3JEV8_9EURY|nr:hypothetical protein HSB1_31770 [Halogranum salarium B-1]